MITCRMHITRNFCMEEKKKRGGGQLFASRRSHSERLPLSAGWPPLQLAVGSRHRRQFSWQPGYLFITCYLLQGRAKHKAKYLSSNERHVLVSIISIHNDEIISRTYLGSPFFFLLDRWLKLCRPHAPTATCRPARSSGSETPKRRGSPCYPPLTIQPF